MRALLLSTCAYALFATMVLATSASGNEAIEDALGGPYTTCTGAIAWTENDNDASRVEPMRLAAPNSDNAAAIALFLTTDEVSPDSAWACMDGACSTHRAIGGAVTTNVLRLRHQADLNSGEAIYEMEAVFLVVNARVAPIQVEGAHGMGSFICEQKLPAHLLAPEEQ